MVAEKSAVWRVGGVSADGRAGLQAHPVAAAALQEHSVGARKGQQRGLAAVDLATTVDFLGGGRKA